MKNFIASGALALSIFAGSQAAAEAIGTPGVPSAFGLAGGGVGISLSGSFGPQRGSSGEDTRFDASSGVTFGFGNPVTGVGVQSGIALTSFRDFGASGYLTLGVHKMFQSSDAGIYSVALNASHIAPWGDSEALDPGISLLGSYLTSFGSNFALVTVGVGNDMNDERDVQGIFGVGVGVGESYAVSIGQVGDRTSIGLTVSPDLLAGTSLGISVNHDWDTHDNTLVVDIGRTFSLFKN